MGLVLEPNEYAQRLPLLSHLYCAQLKPHWVTIVTAFCTVSNRESRNCKKRHTNGSCAQAAGTCSHALLRAHALDRLLQPVLLDSVSSMCCCRIRLAISSNVCVAMAVCLNPQRNSFVLGKIWDHPLKTTYKTTKMGGWGHLVNINPSGNSKFR